MSHLESALIGAYKGTAVSYGKGLSLYKLRSGISVSIFIYTTDKRILQYFDISAL